MGKIIDEEVLAEQIVREFCSVWFEKRSVRETLGFLAEDIYFVGTGECETFSGKPALAKYIECDIGQISEPFTIVFSSICKQRIGGGAVNVFTEFFMKNSLYTWNLRGLFTVRLAGGARLIQSVNISEASKRQKNAEHYPETLVMGSLASQRTRLLNDSIAGGMMGGYIEKNFPFYFINRHMLEYLGYDSEKEFVEDIGGFIINCMHPDDKRMVDKAVNEQLSEADEYVVEYRMKRKDGSYIWVHDLGRRIKAEDDRAAILSVCIDISKQKAAQDEILNLYNNIPGAVFRCKNDRDYSIIDANDGLFEFLGYTREEFAKMGNKMSTVIYPDDFDIMAGVLNKQLRHGNTINNENRLICKDGTVKWISIKAQLIEAEDGERYFYCVFVDITEEKRLHERANELYENELAYFAEIASAEGCTQGRINVTKDIIETYISTYGASIAKEGGSYNDAMSELASSAIDKEDSESICSSLEKEKVIAAFAAGNSDYHFEFLRRKNTGEIFWNSTNLRFCLNPATGDIIVFFYSLDVTEQRLQEKMLEKIAGIDYELITVLDVMKNEYQLISRGSGTKTPIPERGKYGKIISFAADNHIKANDRPQFIEKLGIDYMKNRLENEDSYSFLVETAGNADNMAVKKIQVFYISRPLLRVCVACTDVTDIVRQEQKQKEQLSSALVAAKQANAAKSDFLSRMSHEIRTPMNAIIGMSAIAAQSIGDDDVVEDCISKIGISSRFLLSLINDILDMSRIESGKMLLKNEKIPTEEFINGINSICFSQACEKGVDYECIAEPTLSDYYIGDAMKLQQVLINILSNAIKFTAEGGKVTFSVASRKKLKNSAVVRFVVNDTGIGMSEDFLPHIFDPFSQESTGTTALYGGTGLGLAISKSIVDMMDGNIAVRSIKGVGTEFTVDVKLGITEEEKLRHNQKKQEFNFSELKTLVVDDDVTVCESAVATLREMGITARWVDSGRKAVELIEKLWNTGSYYDIILLDWKMPEMDGIETARRIRDIVGGEVTIIIMTAYDWGAIEHEAKSAGVNMLMSKPMFKSSLVSAFSKAMGVSEQDERRTTEASYDFSSKRVLLAEDNKLNTEVAKMLLECKGFCVDAVENGLRAMELFSRSEPGYYDAILMDIRMPIMDGLTAAVNIRHLSNPDSKKIPIIAMTANAFDDDIEKSKAAGMNAHLAKPIEPERLYQTLYDFIFGKEA